MNGASKILTVSYGTFSCTLEGFDEPFSTMKAIAEYFRDLAADDRYFGAEPPQPDAAMLHRIAEREIQRRVEARVQDNSIVLRAGDQVGNTPAAPLPAAVAAPSFAPVVEQAETAAERLRRLRAAAPLVQAAEPMVLPADPYEEEGADTLQALLADSAAAAEVQADIPSVAAMADPLPEAPAPQPVSARKTAAPKPAAVVEEVAHSSDDALIASLNSTLDFSDAAPVAEPVAQAAQADWDEDYAEDDWEDELPVLTAKSPAIDTPIEGRAQEVYSGTSEDDLLEDLSQEDEVVPSLNDDAIVLNTATENTAPQPAPELAAPVADKLQRARARVIRIRRAEDDVEEAELAAAPVAEPRPEAGSLLSAEAEAALQAELAALTAEFTLDPVQEQPAPAAEPAAAVARKNLAATEQDGDVDRLLAQTNTVMDDEDSRRRQSAISHLKAAVAANEAERKLSGLDLSAGQPRQDPYRADLEQVVRPTRVENTGAERMSPLVLVSEQRIDRPRNSGSTAALTVAASAPAAPQAGPVVPVRPRRLVTGTGAAVRTVPPASALVIDEQDFDDADLDDSTEELAGEKTFSNGENFTDFAERLGAENLADLIEAAGVYCATVLNRPEFPRPLIMRQISGLPGGASASREDVLRGFGQLLRDGRLEKVSRHHFAVTNQSAYLAEAKKIAG